MVYAACFAMKSVRIRIFLASSVFLLILPNLARAGNLDSFLLGDEAAMTGGAVLATTQDSGAVWYNPAGLGKNQRTQVDLTATGLMLRTRQVPKGTIAVMPDGTQVVKGLSASEFLTVATSLSYVRHFAPGMSAGFGIFIPEDDIVNLASSTDAEAQPGASHLRSSVSTRVTRYHAGPAIGWQIAPRLRLGMSLFGVYEKRHARADFVFKYAPSTQSEPRTVGMMLAVEETSTRIGGEAAIGLQAEPWDRVLFALLLRSPRIFLQESYAGNQTLGYVIQRPGAPISQGFEDAQPEAPASVFGLLAPPRAYMGFGLMFDRGSLGFEGDVSPGLRDDRRSVDRAPVWNLRVGGKWDLSKIIGVGAGLFTDRSPQRKASGLPSFRVNYYGLTAGIEIRKPFRVLEEGNIKATYFSTTLAARYALGVGESSQLLFDTGQAFRDGTVTVTTDSQTKVMFHELGLHIGSAIHF